MGRIELTAETFGKVMVCFERYCLGRMTYAPSICERLACDNARVFADPWRSAFVNDILLAYQSDRERIDAGRTSRLGMDFDAEAWLACMDVVARAVVRPGLVPTDVIDITCEADDWRFAVISALRMPEEVRPSDDMLVAALAPVGLDGKWARNAWRDMDERPVESLPRLSVIVAETLRDAGEVPSRP